MASDPRMLMAAGLSVLGRRVAKGSADHDRCAAD
jgi:hypothetical protein